MENEPTRTLPSYWPMEDRILCVTHAAETAMCEIHINTPDLRGEGGVVDAEKYIDINLTSGLG